MKRREGYDFGFWLGLGSRVWGFVPASIYEMQKHMVARPVGEFLPAKSNEGLLDAMPHPLLHSS